MYSNLGQTNHLRINLLLPSTHSTIFNYLYYTSTIWCQLYNNAVHSHIMELSIKSVVCALLRQRSNIWWQLRASLIGGKWAAISSSLDGFIIPVNHSSPLPLSKKTFHFLTTAFYIIIWPWPKNTFKIVWCWSLLSSSTLLWHGLLLYWGLGYILWGLHTTTQAPTIYSTLQYNHFGIGSLHSPF